MNKKTLLFFSTLCLIIVAALFFYTKPKEFTYQITEKEGIEVAFKIKPVENKSEIIEGDDVYVEFRIQDKASKKPVTGLHPAAWIDSRKEVNVADQKLCTNKITSFLSGNFSARPNFDLNAFYVLAMNDTPTISVVDPLFSFGGSQLLAKVYLRSKGEDWALKDGRIFVTMPKIDQLAVVNTFTWKVDKNIEVGDAPTKIAIQPDQHYLWVGNNGEKKNGLTIIDPESLKIVKQIDLKKGSHDIHFSSDSKFAYVSSNESGNVHIIDIAKLKVIQAIKSGESISSMAYSTQSKMLYTTDRTTGAITVIDGIQHKIVAKIQSKPGLEQIKFVPNRQVAVIINQVENEMLVLDPSTNQIIKAGGVEKEPFELSFTEGLIYVRSLSSELVLMIPIEGIERAEVPIKVIDFSGGESLIKTAGTPITAPTLVEAPAGNAVLVTNPADSMIYYYAEGMAAPMGSFKNYGEWGRAVMVVDRSLREESPGIYSTTIKFNDLGMFDVAFFMDSPRMVHCFDMKVAANPKIQKKRTPKVVVKPIKYPKDLKVGESATLTFQVFDGFTNEPKTNLKSVGVMTSLSPGIWQERIWAKDKGKGVYSFDFKPPKTGFYYIFYKVPELGMDYNKIPYNMIQIKAES